MDEMNETMVDEVIENTVENVAEGTHDFKNVGFIALGVAGTALAVYVGRKFVAPAIVKCIDNVKAKCEEKVNAKTDPDAHTVIENVEIVEESEEK